MQYSPKLKNAMAEIEAILKREDLAGVIILHEPGSVEVLTKIDPSYSCASFQHVGGKVGIRLKGKLERDFGGDKEKQHKVLSNTSNMLYHMGTIAANQIMGVLEMSKMLDDKLGATHTDGGFTTIQEQNN